VISILDYGIGNVKSVYNALKYIGISASITRDPMQINNSKGVILPGVGAFGEGMRRIESLALRATIDSIVSSNTPLLGICLGYQLLMNSSSELGNQKGLGYINYDVKRLKVDAKVPHIGWNKISTPSICQSASPLMEGIEGEYFYFVHSYGIEHSITDKQVATVTYGGVELISLVQQANIFGTQFHPEKSGEAGLILLKNFSRLCQNE
jgi:glutamine amidotransferase